MTDTFCILPWIHMMMGANGSIYPCCVVQGNTPFGTINDDIDTIINSDSYKKIRSEMLNGIEPEICKACFSIEEHGGGSFRTNNNELFKHHKSEVLAKTLDDGTLTEFKMRYFDMRASNICNFKCRTCGSDSSSRIAQEEETYFLHDIKNKKVIIKPDNDANVIEKIIDQLDNIEMIYFAGGEPLIMDEHYILIEEILRRNKTDMFLRYNTNASILSYKNTNIIDVWKKFDRVEVYASIDHYGERAEYIRHGTDWGIVESNLKSIKELPNMTFGINTVVSALNYVTLHDFINYMKSVGLESLFSFNISYSPDFLDPIVLPKHLKDQASSNLYGINHLASLLHPIISYVNSEERWLTYKDKFAETIKKYDDIRNEDFISVFPELKELMN